MSSSDAAAAPRVRSRSPRCRGSAAACGFHLRGDVTYAFPTVYVNAPAAAPIAVELKRALEGGGGDAHRRQRDARRR